jgi:hypothetical protein
MESPLQKRTGDALSLKKKTPLKPLTQDDLRTIAIEMVKIVLTESSPVKWDQYLSAEEFGERIAAEVKVLCEVVDKQRRMKTINIPY